jgi:DNA topoisomerase II
MMKTPKTPPKTNPKNIVRVLSFMNSDFKSFSLYDNVRSIPDIRDGLKPSQRKAVWGFLVRGENAPEIPVERSAAQVAAATDYHHGTGSMESTIIGMANNYPGTNNINIFEPSGQFGSRLTKEASSPRYVMSRFSENFRKVFKKEDDIILHNLESDGLKIEPECFIPLLPMVLVNGSIGTGTGHACVIMNYNPTDLKEAITQVVKGKKLRSGDLVPWYKGFHGKVLRNPETGQVIIEGAYKITNTTTIKVTELPIGTYLDQYKEHLQKLEDSGFIKDFEDHSTEEAFEFILNVPRSTTILEHDELMKKLKLISRDTENFTVWGVDGTLKRLNSAEEIIEAWVPWRLERYEERRAKLIEMTAEQIRFASEKLRFILFYLKHTAEFKNQKKADLIAMLMTNKFVDYDKLLGMPMWNLTHDKIEELKKEIDELNKYLTTLKADTSAKMYERELKAFQ